MLKELIDKFYIENQKNKDQAKFYITDAGKCPRAVFFKFKNAPRESLDARILRICEHGEHMHRNIFNILSRLRIGVTTEIPIPAQEIISGRADAILCILRAEDRIVKREIFNIGSNEQNYKLHVIGELIKKALPDIDVGRIKGNIDKRNYRVKFDKLTNSMGFKCKDRIIDEIVKMKEYILNSMAIDINDSRFNNYKTFINTEVNQEA